MEPKGLKDLFTREVLFEKSGPLGRMRSEVVQLDATSKFEFDEENGIHLCRYNERFRFNKAGIQSLVENVGLSLDFALATPVELLVPVLKFHYNDRFKDSKVRLVLQDNRVFILNPNPRDAFVTLRDLVEDAESFLGKDNIAGYHKPHFTPRSVVLNVVLNDVFEVVKKDPLNLGIRFTHCFDGKALTQADAFTFRQFCSNGAITSDEIKSWRRENSNRDSFRSWMGMVVNEARKALTFEHDRLKRLTEIQTDSHTSEILDTILKESRVGKNAREEIRDQVIDKPVRTLYDVYNAITWVATHSEKLSKHEGTVAVLERTASDLSCHSELCPTCHHKLN